MRISFLIKSASSELLYATWCHDEPELSPEAEFCQLVVNLYSSAIFFTLYVSAFFLYCVAHGSQFFSLSIFLWDVGERLKHLVASCLEAFYAYPGSYVRYIFQLQIWKWSWFQLITNWRSLKRTIWVNLHMNKCHTWPFYKLRVLGFW